jgi:hypothetical protein
LAKNANEGKSSRISLLKRAVPQGEVHIPRENVKNGQNHVLTVLELP